jgi:oligoendopeptidase F
LEIENARLEKLVAVLSLDKAMLNGYAECFHDRLHDELLDRELFADLREAGALAARWQNEYNHRRPHNGLKYLPPADVAMTRGGSAPKPPAFLSPESEGRKTEGHRSTNQDQTLIAVGT